MEMEALRVENASLRQQLSSQGALLTTILARLDSLTGRAPLPESLESPTEEGPSQCCRAKVRRSKPGLTTTTPTTWTPDKAPNPLCSNNSSPCSNSNKGNDVRQLRVCKLRLERTCCNIKRRGLESAARFETNREGEDRLGYKPSRPIGASALVSAATTFGRPNCKRCWYRICFTRRSDVANAATTQRRCPGSVVRKT